MSFSATEIAASQTALTARWHQVSPAVDVRAATELPSPAQAFAHLVQHNHLRNFQLWHEEDIARRDDLGFEAVYRAKRAIDRYNQERNNYIEAMDQSLVETLQPRTAGVPRNSETPGMMIDRLSILALKEFHMQEETIRADASPEHRAKCSEKLARLRTQRADLIACLDEFLADLREGRRTFTVYFQFKMYNDPALNPQLYRHAARG